MIIDGKKEAQLLRDEIKKEIESLKSKNNKVPGLAVILIGDFVPSQIYVKNKERNAKEVGINSDIIRYAKDVSEQEVLKKIKPFLSKNAVILFDQIHHVQGWKNEYKALTEVLNENEYEFIAFSEDGQASILLKG